MCNFIWTSNKTASKPLLISRSVMSTINKTNEHWRQWLAQNRTVGLHLCCLLCTLNIRYEIITSSFLVLFVDCKPIKSTTADPSSKRS
jgi:hypothetical protein